MSPEPENIEEFNAALTDIFTSLISRSKQEREKSEPYKQLFKASEHGLSGLLSDAHRQLDQIIRDVSDVIEKKFKIKANVKLYDLLKALPFASRKLRENISKEEGSCCEADKMRYIYSQEVLSVIKEIQNEQGT